MTTGSITAGLLNGVAVLLLDDDADDREALAAGLRRHGAQVFEAGSAQTGLLLVEAHRPDVLVVDLELPEIDGFEFLRAVRRLAPGAGNQTPAVALCGHRRPDTRRRTLLAGFRLLLSKPISADEVANTLASVLILFPNPSLVR